MRKIDFGQGLAIVANFSVVAGIVLLAYELHQNNSLLRAQASYSLMLDRTEARNSLVNASEEVADFWLRVSSNTPLTAADELRLTAWVEATFLKWQFEYGQFADGNLSEAEPFGVTASQTSGSFRRSGDRCGTSCVQISYGGWRPMSSRKREPIPASERLALGCSSGRRRERRRCFRGNIFVPRPSSPRTLRRRPPGGWRAAQGPRRESEHDLKSCDD
jgi:hypothetical protein